MSNHSWRLAAWLCCGCRILRCSCVILTFLASFTVFICFDFCTSDLRSSCCLRTSSLYEIFVLRSVDTLLVSTWGLHTMTSLSWLATRAAIVSLRYNAPKLDAVTKQVISWFGLSLRANVDDVIRGIPVVVGYRSRRYLEPGVQYQGRRDARTTTVKIVPRCSSRSVLRLGLFNARSVGEKSAAVLQWITDIKLSPAALVETWHDDASSPQLIACAPPGFKYVESARPRKGSSTTSTNHDGICLYYEPSLHARTSPAARRYLHVTRMDGQTDNVFVRYYCYTAYCLQLCTNLCFVFVFIACTFY